MLIYLFIYNTLSKSLIEVITILVIITCINDFIIQFENDCIILWEFIRQGFTNGY